MLAGRPAGPRLAVPLALVAAAALWFPARPVLAADSETDAHSPAAPPPAATATFDLALAGPALVALSPPPLTLALLQEPPPAPEQRKPSTWRKLHPILGWTSLALMVGNAFIGPKLKQEIDAGKKPPDWMANTHALVAGGALLAWGGTLSTLLAAKPEGQRRMPKAHKWLGVAHIPLFVGTIAMGLTTRVLTEEESMKKAPDLPDYQSHSNIALVHDWFVIGGLVAYAATAAVTIASDAPN